MEETQKAAAEAQAQGPARFGLVLEARIVEAQLADAVAQVVVVGGIHGVHAAEDDGLGRPEARQRRVGRLAVVGERVAYPGVGDLLDGGGDEADLPRAELVDDQGLGRHHPDAVDMVRRPGAHEADLLALADGAVLDPDQGDDAEVGVVPAVDDQRLEHGAGIARGCRQAVDDGLQDLVDAEPGLGRDHQGVGGVETNDVLDLLLDPVGLGRRQVDLVEHGHQFEVGVDRLVGVGQRLRLDPLRGVDQQEGTLAGAHRAADLVGEIDVSRRVDEVEEIILAVPGPVLEPHRLRLDGDAALALDVHGIEHLGGHLARLQPAAALDQPIGQRRLAVIDVRHDGEVADMGEVGHSVSSSLAPLPASTCSLMVRGKSRRPCSTRSTRSSPGSMR